MMNIKLTVLFGLIYILLIANQSFGQNKFKNDPKFNFYFDRLLLDVGILHPKLDKVDFEFRYWIRDLSRVNAHQLIIVQKSNNGIWSYKRYQLCFKTSRYEIIDEQSGNLHDWEVIWTQLTDLRILNLKTEADVRHKWKKSSTSYYMLTADGTQYAFEFITPKKRRQYLYTNPRTNLKTYDKDNIELVRVDRIINILESQLHLEDSTKKYCSIENQ